MEKFVTLESTAVPINVEDIDTDQIIPARFLKATNKSGFGENLFRDWRYDENGKPKPDFPLNNDTFKGKILVAGKNFGCGSSREHAAWSITDYGFKCVVSSFFADIFKNNALNNGLLPVQVSDSFLTQLFKAITENPDIKINVNLLEQTISVPSLNLSESFDINNYKKHCLINGLDDIDFLLSIKTKIQQYTEAVKTY